MISAIKTSHVYQNRSAATLRPKSITKDIVANLNDCQQYCSIPIITIVVLKNPYNKDFVLSFA